MARSNDPRFNNPRYLEQENLNLMKDVEDLEDALMLHARIQDETGGSVRTLLRKEIGGSLWQRGAEGRIHGYRSAKDLSEKPRNVLDRTNPKTNSAGKTRMSLAAEESRNGAENEKLTDNYLITKHLTDRARNTSDKTSVKTNSAGKKRNPRTTEEMKNGFSSDQMNMGRTLMKDVDIVGKSVHSAKSAKKSDWLLAPMYQSQMTSSGDSVYMGDTSSFTDDCDGPMNAFSTSGERDDSSVADSSDSPQQRSVGGATRWIKPMKQKQRFFKKVLEKYEMQTAKTDVDANDASDTSCDAEVLQWLKGLQLRDTRKYVRIFADHELDMSSLRLLTRTQLQQMGVMALGPLNKMVLAIRELRQYGPRPRAVSLNGGTSSRESSAATDRRHSGYPADYAVESDPTACRGSRKPRKQNGVVATGTRRSAPPRPIVSKVTSKPPSAWNMTCGGTGKGGKGLGSGRSSSSPSEAMGSSRRVDTEVTPSDQVDSCTTDSDLNSLISVSGIQKQSRKLDLGKLDTTTEIQKSARESCRKAEKHLVTLEAEIQTLQQDRGNPLSLTKIEELQLKLHQIQQQMTQQKQQSPQTDIADTDQLQNSPSQPAPPSPLAVTESDLQQCYMDNGKVTSGREAKQRGRTGESLGKTSAGKTVSMSMTKSELLHEVRKQKQEHRRYIRHLQSELTRLKVKDPLRSCEVGKEDIVLAEDAVIGEGAFSKVFHGSFQGSEVALKRLKVPLQVQDQNYFTAEVNLLRELRHPRVVLLLGVCTSTPLPIMVLEYMAQGSLYHYLHHPHIPSLDHAAFYQIARDMALGMNYLHRHRPAVLHLDLKSTNVLLNDDLRAKIADFGFSKLKHDADVVAKQHKHQSGQGHLKGTPAWMAPELFDSGDITPKSDVYSFAVILWEMVTGRLPYEGCSVFQVIERVRKNKRPEIPGEESCPEGLRTLIERCWAQKSTMRPQFKSILQSLDELHFPPEWRSLFSAAGVPDSTLDDIRSTRTLISLVSQSVEPQGDRPCGVPPLQLNDDDSDDASSTQKCGSPTFAGAKTSAKKMVTESMTQEAVDEMDFMYSDRAGGTTQGPTLVPQIDVSASALATPAASICFDAPPIPPPTLPPTLSLETSPVKPKVSPKPTKPKPSVVRESFLDELKAGLSNLNQRPPRIAECSNGEDVKGHEVKGCKMADIRQSMLLSQRGRLKPTVQPHPNQLHNLKDIDREQLNSLTEIIRKAIAQRRTAMQEGVASIDESPLNSKWSVTDDWGV